MQQQRHGSKKNSGSKKAPAKQTGLVLLPSPVDSKGDDEDAYTSPLLIFTCQRAQYLTQTLDDVLANSGDHCGFGCPIIVSEDGKKFLLC